MIERREVEAFLYREARLMDEHAYDEWLELFTEDAEYWIPAGAADSEPSTSISIVYATKQQLEDRIHRLKSGSAYAQDPPSAVARVVSNVELDPGTNGNTLVRSVFNLTDLRRDQQLTFAGRVEHTLCRVDGEIRILRKKVLLLERRRPIGNLTFLV